MMQLALDVSLTHDFADFNLDVSFKAPDGLTALFGKSGSGKTSIVNAIAGLLQPRTGRISLGGNILLDSATSEAVPAHNRNIGYVFQEGRLFPHLSVEQNLNFSKRFSKNTAAQLPTNDVINLLGIGDLLKRRPTNLSGGEKQRVAIGRALLSNPKLLLMDEPLASLDEARKAEIIPYLERLRDNAGIPILYVSHSIAEVSRLATTLITLENGKVVQSGPAKEVLSAPGATAKFGLSLAGGVLDARIQSHHSEDGLTQLNVSKGNLLVPQIAAEIGSQVHVHINADDIILAQQVPKGISALNALPVEITNVRPGSGADIIADLQSGEDQLQARITRRSAQLLKFEPGASCYAIIKSTRIGGIRDV